MSVKDLIGRKFGRLLVLEPSETRERHYLCKCDCGNVKEIRKGNLTSGHTRSCGCLSRELLSERLKKDNTFFFRDDYVVGLTRKGEEFLISKEDLEAVSRYCWCIGGRGYLWARVNGKMTTLHRFLLGSKGNLDIDHINRCKTDNTRANLRHVTRSENMMNTDLRSCSTSGVTGVHWDKHKGKWNAYIGVDNKRINLGYFEDKADATQTRKQAEKKYFGHILEVI